MARTATAAPPQPGADAAPPGRSRKLIALVAIVAVVGLGAAGGTYVLLSGGDADAAEEEPAPEEGAVVDVAEMTLNLAGPVNAYAKISFAAVLSEGVDEASVTGSFPLLKDAAISEVGTFAPETLRTPEGVDELRARLSARANQVYPDGEVLRIVLTELVVQ